MNLNHLPTYSTWYRVINLAQQRNDFIDKRWLNFWNFLEDMGSKPNIGINRICLVRLDSSKGYYKENCKWMRLDELAKSTIEKQSKNHRIMLRIENKVISLVQICQMLYIDRQVVYNRIFQYNWPIEKALEVTEEKIKEIYDRI